ncbi:hypothetical protein MMC29_004960 [Sticta canariensis]|nr:hypothetical protein [Sticta canariensis]
MTDITDHDLNAQSRALDPANDCSYEKDAYSRRQPKIVSMRISFVIPSRYYTENHDQDNDGVKNSTSESRFSAVKFVWSSPLIRHISYRADFKAGDHDTARSIKEAKKRRRHILRNSTSNHDQDNDVDKLSTSMSRFSKRREFTSPEPSVHHLPIFQPYHPEHPKYVALSWRTWGNSTGNDDQDTDVDKFSSSGSGFSIARYDLCFAVHYPLIPQVVAIRKSEGYLPFFVGIVHKIAGLKQPKERGFQHLVKHVSLRPLRTLTGNHDQDNDLDEFSISWSMRYAVIQDRTMALQMWSIGSTTPWVRNTIAIGKKKMAILCKGPEHSPQICIQSWENSLLWALQYKPRSALEALDFALSYRMLRVPKHTVDDSLDHLTRFHLEKLKSPPSFIVDMVYRIICNLAERSHLQDEQPAFVRTETLYWVLYHCDNDQVMSLYNHVRENPYCVSASSWLNFLERFIEMGKIQLSMEVLRKFSLSLSTGADQSSCAWLINSLLKFKYENYDKMNLYRMRKKVLAQIVQMGIRPDITAYTKIIVSAFEAEQYQSAVRFYKLGWEVGLKPNSASYAALLKAGLQISDCSFLEMIVRDAEADGTFYGDESLIFKLLRAKYKVEESTTDTFSFDAMLRTYKKYCNPHLVQELGLCERDGNLSETPNHLLIWPSRRILGFMLVIYIRQHTNSVELLNLYHRYYRFVEECHPTIATVEETDHVANAFIFAFGQREQMLHMGVKIVNKMLQNNARSETSNSTTRMPFKLAAPTAHTWSILAMNYARHGQQRATKKVLEMMRERGLEPDRVTWNGIISGYSALQRIDEAVATVKRMEAEGFEMDSYTLKALGRYGDRDRLLQVLRQELAIDDADWEQDLDEHADANAA